MIGERIAEIRKQKGYTLSELAEKTNISKSYLSNIERNLNKNPSLAIMTKIAKALNVDLIVLLRNDSADESLQQIDKEWLEFVYELKSIGIKKDELQELKSLIEFVKWKNQHGDLG
ncbi:helix-turn-helix domain-containing protein [Bacillus rubiinfantis]|uniref:helix-turn-helix domain-containing protein n=1 Tax=Bacillus rubiinfantis TaxID=1499680 RepID=UPI0005A7B185|nr:helix-turn-helix transcriptional regulator [Bacillus rubiinfantis]